MGDRRSAAPAGGARTSYGQAFGQWGEDQACRFLERLGWQILERNWRCDLGELDIVALEPDPAGDVIVFVEVKTRAGTGFGRPLEAITVAKQRRLRDLAGRWLAVHERHAPGVRIDAIGVLRGSRVPTIEHVRGVS